jgi:hypothetical protein
MKEQVYIYTAEESVELVERQKYTVARIMYSRTFIITESIWSEMKWKIFLRS